MIDPAEWYDLVEEEEFQTKRGRVHKKRKDQRTPDHAGMGVILTAIAGVL